MFGLSAQAQRVIIGAVAAALVTIIGVLPIDPNLQTLGIAVVSAIAGYLVPRVTE